ncbi:MAG: FAD-dependent oxidoreductase [Nitriliruptoraceae bacterium]|nr:FAD-dependent oxidoreductase [Nitriliruptoraceae bacterium]
MVRRLVVIGGDAGGMSAASQARRRQPVEQLEILAFERGPFTSYSACGIPYWIGGVIDDRDELIARAPEEFRERQDIDVRTGHEVVAIDTDAREVSVRDTDGTRSVHGYDDLLIATGASPIRPDVPGIDAAGVLGVQNLVDGQRMLDLLEREEPARATVIGGGYIGLEMAEAMVQRGLSVTLIDRAPQPMSTIDPELGVHIAEAMAQMGIDLRLETDLEGIETDDTGNVRAVVTDAGRVETDLVVLGTGARPNSDLGAAAGLPTGARGGLVTDARQRTPVDGVWAAGDCTQVFHRLTQRPTAIALGTIANKQGRVAGINLGGGYARFPGVLGTAVTKVCGLEIARTGLGEREAREAGFEVVVAEVRSTTRAHYFPGATWMRIRVIAEQGTGRLLGAQIVGEEGGAKRIDVFAMALWQGIGVQELIDVDLSYAPPFSPVWDPVLIAARKAWDAVDAERLED